MDQASFMMEIFILGNVLVAAGAIWIAWWLARRSLRGVFLSAMLLIVSMLAPVLLSGVYFLCRAVMRIGPKLLVSIAESPLGALAYIFESGGEMAFIGVLVGPVTFLIVRGRSWRQRAARVAAPVN